MKKSIAKIIFINNLSLFSKRLARKQAQVKSKASRRVEIMQIRAENNGMKAGIW